MVLIFRKFSEELLEGLETLNDWPDKVKIMQKNWIGKSFGCEIDFKIEGNKEIEKLNVLQLDLIHCLDFLS